jgi:hypothetical protein
VTLREEGASGCLCPVASREEKLHGSAIRKGGMANGKKIRPTTPDLDLSVSHCGSDFTCSQPFV